MGNRSMDMGQGSQYPTLVRDDGSLYNHLAIDEVQSQLGNTGKPLHNMLFDDLLKNVFSGESGQLVQNPASDSFLLGNNNGLNGTSFSNKTITDQGWREIFHQQHFNRSIENNNNLYQSNLGEMKLEDVIVDHAQPLMGIDPAVMVSQSQQQNWLPLQMQMPSVNIHQQELQQQQQQHQQIIGLCPDFSTVSSESGYENPVMKIGYSENPMVAVAAMSSTGTCSDSNKGGGVVGRKRMYSDEKSIERRQKRMAKNRESAAKSRAKKQAYIKKLEADKERLQETISWLHKRKEVEARFLSDTTLTPKYQLRRTSSTTF